MAKNRKYSHLDDMRGQLGDLIVSRNRYGSITYIKPEYNHLSTPAQIKSQQKLDKVMEIWHKLGPDKISFWNMYASMRPVQSMCSPSNVSTGVLFFIYLKRNLQEINEPISSKLDTYFMNGVQHILDFNLGLKDFRYKKSITLNFEPELDENTKMIIYATPPLEGGLGKAKDSWYRKIDVIDTGFRQGSRITAQYNKIFGEIGKKAMSIYFRFKTVDIRSGMASNAELSTKLLLLRQEEE